MHADSDNQQRSTALYLIQVNQSRTSRRTEENPSQVRSRLRLVVVLRYTGTTFSPNYVLVFSSSTVPLFSY